MMYSSVALTAVSLTLLRSTQAQVFVSKSTDSAVVASALSSISSLEALLQPPSKIAPELTGIPASVTSALNDPSQISSLQSEFAESLPAWYRSLPSDAQAYIVSAATVAQSVYPQIFSLEQVAGINVAPSTGLISGSMTTQGASTLSTAQPGGPLSTSTDTEGSGTRTTQNGSSWSPSSAGATSTSTSQPGGPLNSATGTGAAATSSSSSAAAAGSTGTLAVGLLGAMGVLGVAVAL